MAAALLSVCLAVLSILLPTALATPNTVVHFYKHTNCSSAETFVKVVVQKWYFSDPSITAALLRMQYTDCFVRGCDASILLDAYEGSVPEKKAPQNLGLRGFDLIDDIKAVLEAKCPGIVSCADIIALATRDAVSLAGGPAYPVPTGRRDGARSSIQDVNLPGPYISLKHAIAYFKTKGLDVTDLVTLLGAHNVGYAHCQYIRNRLYNYEGTGRADPSLDAGRLKSLKKLCPLEGASYDIRKDPKVFLTPASGKDFVFDNSYYSQILQHKAVLGIDQELIASNLTSELVRDIAKDFFSYKFSFAYSMARMGDIGVLTGNDGEIRQNCRFTNQNNPKLASPKP